MKYYIVVTEWNYPAESGRDVREDFDTLEEAVGRCKELCEGELGNFEDVCGDALVPEVYEVDGVPAGCLVTPANGLDDWWFAAKAVEVAHGV